MLLCSKVNVNSLAILPGIFLKYVLAFLQSFAYVLFSSSKKSAVIITSNPHSHPADCFVTRIGTRNQNSRIHCGFVNSTHHRATVRIYTAANLLLKSETFDGVVMRTHVRTDLQWCIFYLFFTHRSLARFSSASNTNNSPILLLQVLSDTTSKQSTLSSILAKECTVSETEQQKITVYLSVYLQFHYLNQLSHYLFR